MAVDSYKELVSWLACMPELDDRDRRDCENCQYRLQKIESAIFGKPEP
jgi:hypothetical protein